MRKRREQQVSSHHRLKILGKQLSFISPVIYITWAVLGIKVREHPERLQNPAQGC